MDSSEWVNNLPINRIVPVEFEPFVPSVPHFPIFRPRLQGGLLATLLKHLPFHLSSLVSKKPYNPNRIETEATIPVSHLISSLS